MSEQRVALTIEQQLLLYPRAFVRLRLLRIALDDQFFRDGDSVILGGKLAIALDYNEWPLSEPERV